MEVTLTHFFEVPITFYNDNYVIHDINCIDVMDLFN